MSKGLQFFKILVGINSFAFIKAGSEQFLILTDAYISRHSGTLSVENQDGKPFLRAKVNGKPLEWYELCNEISEAQWQEEFEAFCQEA